MSGAPAPLIAAAIAATARRSLAISNPVEVHLPMFAHSSPEATLAFTRALPRNASGKIPREALLALAVHLQAARTAR